MDEASRVVPAAPVTAAMCAVLAGALLVGCAAELREPAVPSRPHVVAATYNVNFGLAGDPATLAAILQADADVVCLQETTPAWEAAIEGTPELVAHFPYRAFVHSGGAGGLALLSRFPFREGRVADGVDGWFPAWRVVVEAPLGPLQLLIVHLRPPVEGGSYVSGYFARPGVHRAEMGRFAELLDAGLPTLVLGDFNEEPGGAALGRLQDLGFVDVLPQYAEDAVTWRWPTSLLELTGQLDHIACSGELEPLWAEVRDEGRSDHLPVVAAFQLAPAATRGGSGSGSSP